MFLRSELPLINRRKNLKSAQELYNPAKMAPQSIKSLKVCVIGAGELNSRPGSPFHALTGRQEWAG